MREMRGVCPPQMRTLEVNPAVDDERAFREVSCDRVLPIGIL
jgi:hypothetical protein